MLTLWPHPLLWPPQDVASSDAGLMLGITNSCRWGVAEREASWQHLLPVSCD